MTILLQSPGLVQVPHWSHCKEEVYEIEKWLKKGELNLSSFIPYINNQSTKITPILFWPKEVVRYVKVRRHGHEDDKSGDLYDKRGDLYDKREMDGPLKLGIWSLISGREET